MKYLDSATLKELAGAMLVDDDPVIAILLHDRTQRRGSMPQKSPNIQYAWAAYQPLQLSVMLHGLGKVRHRTITVA